MQNTEFFLFAWAIFAEVPQQKLSYTKGLLTKNSCTLSKLIRRGHTTSILTRHRMSAVKRMRSNVAMTCQI